MKGRVNILFGERLSKLRRLKGVSQEEFADRCGIHRTYIGALERGEKSPTLNTIEKIANALEITMKELFE